jgi:transposase
MKKNIIKLLNVKGIRIESFDFTDHFAVFEVFYTRKCCICPYCKKKIKRVHSNHSRYINHGTFKERILKLKVHYRRFFCRKCLRAFTEPHAVVFDRKKTSIPEREHIVLLAANQSCKDTGNQSGMSSPTVMRYLHEARRVVGLPSGDIRLVIDEHSFSKKNMKASIGEINSGSLVAILHSRNKEVIRKWIRSHSSEELQRISEVSIDMWPAYKNVCEEELPNAHIVIDKFHVIKDVLHKLDGLRKIIQEVGPKGYRRINRFLFLKNKENLTEKEKVELMEVFEIYKKFPNLKQCYNLKERLRDIYKLEDKKEATRRYDVLLTAIENEPKGVLQDIHGTLSRWRPYILNYFDRRTTSAMIEGMHCKMKTTKRISYGFRNFRNYEVKLFTAFANGAKCTH